jgi:hypothetical protein
MALDKECDRAPFRPLNSVRVAPANADNKAAMAAALNTNLMRAIEVI